MEQIWSKGEELRMRYQDNLPVFQLLSLDSLVETSLQHAIQLSNQCQKHYKKIEPGKLQVFLFLDWYMNFLGILRILKL